MSKIKRRHVNQSAQNRNVSSTVQPRATTHQGRARDGFWAQLCTYKGLGGLATSLLALSAGAWAFSGMRREVSTSVSAGNWGHSWLQAGLQPKAASVPGVGVGRAANVPYRDNFLLTQDLVPFFRRNDQLAWPNDQGRAALAASLKQIWASHEFAIIGEAHDSVGAQLFRLELVHTIAADDDVLVFFEGHNRDETYFSANQAFNDMPLAQRARMYGLENPWTHALSSLTHYYLNVLATCMNVGALSHEPLTFVLPQDAATNLHLAADIDPSAPQPRTTNELVAHLWPTLQSWARSVGQRRVCIESWVTFMQDDDVASLPISALLNQHIGQQLALSRPGSTWHHDWNAALGTQVRNSAPTTAMEVAALLKSYVNHVLANAPDQSSYAPIQPMLTEPLTTASANHFRDTFMNAQRTEEWLQVLQAARQRWPQHKKLILAGAAHGPDLMKSLNPSLGDEQASLALTT